MLAKRTGKGRVAIANPEVERELALLQSRSGSPAAVQALAAAIEERDNYTHEHSEQVVHLARGVAMMLGLPADDVERIAHAALLHDVGKLAMPAELLRQERPAHERRVGGHVRAPDRRRADPGPHQGARRRSPRSSATSTSTGTAPATRTGSRRERIPVGSRVILACDAYVAMTTDAALPRGDPGRRRRRRAARPRGLEVRPRGHRRPARPARPPPAAGPRPLGGREARRRAAARAYRPALSAGVGTGRVISVAE